tara:strand:+ start:72 stop:389 length:318 start_codon:yes stop_codon:yes gene_type:complete
MRLLLDPKSIRRNSKMPQHRFLFNVVEYGDGENVITLKDGDKETYYKPTKDAEALVDYLLSLKSANYPLDEAPVNQPFTSSLPKPNASEKENEQMVSAPDTDSSK